MVLFFFICFYLDVYKSKAEELHAVALVLSQCYFLGVAFGQECS